MKNRKLYSKIISLLLAYKNYILGMSLLMIFITVGTAFIPLLQQEIVDSGLMSGDLGILGTLVLMVIALTIITNLASLFQSYLRINLNAKFLKDKQVEVLNHSLKLKMDYIKNDGLVQIIKDAEYALNNLSMLTGEEMSNTLVQIFKFIGVFIGLILINWKLTLFLLFVIPARIFVANKLGKHVEKYQMDTLMIQKGIHGWEDDIYHSATEVKLWNLYDNKCREYDKLLQNRNTAIKKLSFFIVLSDLLGQDIQALFLNMLYVLGGILIWGGELSIGGIVAFITYATYLLEPIGFIANLRMIFSQVGPAFNMYEDFLSYQEEELEREKKNKISCCDVESVDFRVQNLSFSFKNRELLQSLCFDIKEGDRIAIVGENGSGKSTLLNIFLRFYDLQEGCITLNGKVISDYELFSYRDLFSVIMQNPYLFRGTVKDNLTLFGKNELTQEILDNKLLDFVEHLSEGYDTDIGSDASHISGGEKQKIALMRALASKSKILILDEPTAAYDKQSEKEFLDVLRGCNKKIIILITHEPKLLQFANKIIEIENMQIKQYGSYKEYQESR
ncbi:ABC transporter ATP-binding protein [Lachnospiraceae bacterium DSM 108991]|uniref:ABC transporter ATP-binding protein n=1 Tax=Claveliimonas monacensis TaxID=2779351 RepID=A0ABR9RLN7_9FIRM|nr:ABC transporter ATP-binding protein [Claveliimonas monacensis]MBE5063880.1 ABC transporter ATP-binding protein [Claveliimonas monacensis]